MDLEKKTDALASGLLIGVLGYHFIGRLSWTNGRVSLGPTAHARAFAERVSASGGRSFA